MNDTIQDNKDELRGIGGWLILVAIGVFVRPFQLALITYVIGSSFSGLETFIMEYPDVNTSYLAGLLSMELIMNFLCLILSIYLVYLFIKKKALFKKLILLFFMAYPLFLCLDSFLSFIILKLPMDMMTIGVQIISFAIWSAYILQSKRVENTFVN